MTVIGPLHVAAAAPAATTIELLRDCTDGALSKSYPPQLLADALAHLPADVDEYSDCRGVLRRAQLTGTSGQFGGSPAGERQSSGGTATPNSAMSGGDPDPLASATPEERASFQNAVAAASALAPVELDGRPVRIDHPSPRPLPKPLIVLLALAGAGAGIGVVQRGFRRRAARSS